MLKRVKSIFKTQNDPLKSFDATNKNEILKFEEKLNQIVELPQNDQAIEILQLSTDFTNLFGSLNSQQFNNERISQIYQKYLKYVADLAEVIFEISDKDYEYVFRSLKLIGNQLGSIPNSSNFVQFYYQILKKAKSGDINCLSLSMSFACFLFKDEDFFKAFSFEIDGLTSIFTSFFITNNKEAMDILMELLFSIVPDTFYSTPSPTLLAVCKDSMNNDNCPECALFLCNYLALLSSNCSEKIIENFFNEDGFTCLNHFLITHCQKSVAKDCYETLLLKKGKPTKFTLKGLYGVYYSIPDYQEFSLEILRRLKSNQIQNFVPIHAWVLNENDMKEGSIISIFSIMLQIGITDYVDNIFTIIEKYPKFKNNFLELIYVSLNEKNFDPANLIEPKQIPYPKSTTPVTLTITNSFLSRFVIKISKEQLKSYLLDESKFFREILLAAYSCPKSAKIREEVLSKLIDIYDTDKLNTIMIELLEVDLTCEMFTLLLSNLINPLVSTLFIYALESHLCPFDYEYFVSLNGFSNFDILLEECKQNKDLLFVSSNIIKIIELFTRNGPRHEIDEWIINLPNDSVLFEEKNHKFLAKIAVNEKTMFLNVPSLLLFSVLVQKKEEEENSSQKKKTLFDITSPVCLFNAGKYGIPMFLKRNMKIVDSVPSYEAIVNRYINPTIYNEIEEDYDHYPNFINSNEYSQSIPLNFELYELYLSGNSETNASVTVKDIEKNGSASNPIKSIDFRFFIPSNYEDVRVSILKCELLEIEYFNGVLVFKTNYRSDSAPARINKKNTFVHIKCIFATNKVNVKVWFEKISEFIHDEDEDYQLKPIDKILDIDTIYPHYITLGGRYSSAQLVNQNFASYRLIFDRYVFINNRLALFEQLNGNAYKVPYYGFFSYMIKERTRVFLKLEELQNTPHFTQVYIAILMMIKYLNDDIYNNNGISFASYISEGSSKIISGFSDEISKEYLFSRLLFSLKRSVSSISDNVLAYFHQLPYTILNEEDFADFTYIILIDFEIYFLFDKQLILSYLNLVKNDIQGSNVLVQKLINYKTSSFLVAIIKRLYEIKDISDDILDMIYQILTHIDDEHKGGLTHFINESVVVSYWKFHFMIDTFSAKSIMELQQVESPLQVSFLNTVKKILQSLNEITYSANSFVRYSLFFNDERSLIFLEIIANYSYHVLNYIDSNKTPYLNYAFARYAENEKAWLIAFTILGGYPEVLTEFPSSLTIKLAKFAPTIMIMLIRLLASQSLSVFKGDDEIKNKELAEKVFSTLMSIPLNDFQFFSTDLALVSLLCNFGIIPKSIQLTFDSDRIKYKMNDDDVIKMSSIDLSAFKEIEIFKDKELLEAKIECFKLPDFADDLVNCEWVNMLDFTRLISFISKIILSTDFSSFAQIAVGNALMYNAYQKKFAKELIFHILTHYQNITKSESFLKKSVSNFMQVVSTAARCSVFNDCYLKFLDKVIAFLKTWCISKNIDPSYYAKDLRDIVIYSIHFISDENELQERDKLLNSNKDIIYNQQMNENLDYVVIVNTYIFKTANQANTTLAVEKYSQIDLLITNNFRINEFPSLPISTLNPLFTDSSSPISISSISSQRSVRILNAKKILEWAESFLYESSRGTLFVKAVKTGYVYQSILCQFDHIQIYCRVLEQKLFRCIKDEYIYHQNYSSFIKEKEEDNKYEIKSYYLSQIAEPYYSPRNVFPSPFEIKSPPIDEKTSDFSIYMPSKNADINSKIHYVDFFGQLMFPYQWCQDLSIFKHSYVFTPGGSDSENHPFYDISSLIDPKNNTFKFSTSNASKEVKKTILKDFIKIFGTFSHCLEVDLLYYVHKIPSLLFIQEDKIILFILSTKKNFLIKYYQHSLLLVPLNQQVLLNEYHDTSIFCGHYALLFYDKRFVKYDEHYYSHEKRSLSLFYKADPNIVIVFKSTKDLEILLTKKYNLINKTNSNISIYSNENFYNADITNYNFNLSINNFNIDRIKTFRANSQRNSAFYTVNYSYIQSLPHNSFFFVSTPPKEIILYWLEHEISSFDYLIFLNLLSSRSFVDLSQYPVFPWVCTPIDKKLKMRDLSKPMGQISEERAHHFDDIYEGLKDELGYFYGCHYSNPAIVIWYLLRLPPFNYLTWELNNGWDAKSRMFKSITAAYISASTTNPTDVKELIPEMYSVPMSLTNESHLNCLPSNVQLPTTQDNSEISSSLFVSMNRKYLESSPNINLWIDLIFGYKQSGPEALKSKNIFLPTSYHDSTPESNQMDKDVFEAHVNNFGQCPTQLLIDKAHPSRTERVTKTAEEFSKSMSIIIPYSTYSFYHFFFNVKKIDLREAIKSEGSQKRSKNSIRNRLRSMTRTDSSKKIKCDEPNVSYTFNLSLSAQDTTINDLYFVSSGLDQCSRFMHFISNDKKEGSNSACGDIEIRWKLINTEGLMVPLRSVPIIPNDINKYMDQRLISPSSVSSSPSSNSQQTQQQQQSSSSLIDNITVSISAPWVWFVGGSFSTTDDLRDSAFVVSYEGNEVITIRKINNSKNGLISRFFKNANDENNSSLKQNAVSNSFNSTSELIAAYKDIDGYYLNHISVSNDGLYIVASYDNGMVKVFRIEYDKIIPQRIRLVNFFTQNSEVLLSRISSRDMLVFSVLNDGKLVIWSFATRLKHREFDLGIKKKSICSRIYHKSIDNNCTKFCDVVDLINDDFDGCVTVLLIDRILQFSSNGTSILREFVLTQENDDENDSLLSYFTSIALYPLDFSFDQRILIVGDNKGSIYFFAVSIPEFGKPDLSEIEVKETENDNDNDNDNKESESDDDDEAKNSSINENGQLVLVGVHKNLLKSQVSSIFVDKEACCIIANDQRGGSIVLKMDPFIIYNKIDRCEKCLNEKTGSCKQCGAPICPVCPNYGMCNNCKDSTYLSSPFL